LTLLIFLIFLQAFYLSFSKTLLNFLIFYSLINLFFFICHFSPSIKMSFSMALKNLNYSHSKSNYSKPNFFSNQTQEHSFPSTLISSLFNPPLNESTFIINLYFCHSHLTLLNTLSIFKCKIYQPLKK
jgi:hypothetical protein